MDAISQFLGIDGLKTYCCNRCYLRDRRDFPLPGDISADVSMV